MTFHDPFWAAVATAAPVVGIAHAVLVGRYTAQIDDLMVVRAEQIAAAEDRLTEAKRRTLDARASVDFRIGELEEYRRNPEAIPRDTTVRTLRAGTVEQFAEVLIAQVQEALEARQNEEAERARELDRIRALRRPASRVALLSLIVDSFAVFSWLMCTTALIVGLASLSEGSDIISRWLAIALIGIPMGFAVAGPAADKPIKNRLKRLGMP